MLTKNDQQTKDFAKNLVKELSSPTVLALIGELGAGKTTFVQGLAEELGITKRVLSPTFVFLRSYNLNHKTFKRLHHFDLYRCENIENVKSIGLPEVLEEKDTLIVIEWPEIAKELLPENTKWVNFKKVSETQREISFS